MNDDLYKNKATAYVAKHVPFASDDIKKIIALHIAVALREWEKEKGNGTVEG